MTVRLRERLRNEDGATLAIMTAGLVVMVMIAAVVIDLAAVRADRAQGRLVTDAAATAGSLELFDRDGRAACTTAVAFAGENIDVSGPFVGIDCSTFPTSCDATTPSRTTAGTADDWTLTVVYPVRGGDSLLDPAAIGSGAQPVTTGDGDACDRIGVQVEATHRSFFAGVLGTDTLRTAVHSVALATDNVGGSVPINLLILERYDCDAVVAEGSGGGSGGILVDAVINPDTGEVVPGFIAVDSNGTGAGCGADGTIDVDGNNSSIQADGPDGCDGQLGSRIAPGGQTIGQGCGQLRAYAIGTPGCNPPACTSTGTVAPDPTKLFERKSRAAVDYLFNCKASYPFAPGWEIDPCPDPPAPHIDDLIRDYGTAGTTPPGFVTWTSLGHPCTVEGPGGTTITVSGNVRVDCPSFNVKRNAIFQGGDVIFDGDVIVESSGVLAINADATAPFPYAASRPEAIAFFRGGVVRKAGSASVILHRTMAYFSPTTSLSMAGGSGTLIWTAPLSGVFQPLALWSESSATHALAGQSELDLEGVFFVPDATVTYQGDGQQRSVQAQFIVRKLQVAGNGRLVVAPLYERAVFFPVTMAQLIR